MFIRLLGPVVGRLRQAEIDVGSPRQQAVLAMLATNPGRVVPLDSLVDGIWGEDPPRSATQNVYTYVAGLRRALEPDRKRRERSKLLAGGANGYVLHVQDQDVDSVLFADYVGQARRLPPEAALR